MFDCCKHIARECVKENAGVMYAYQSETSENSTRLNVIRSFSAAAYALNVEVILIEPSILFNLLSNSQQKFLLKKGSNSNDFRYVPGILTFGFLDKYKKYITQPEFAFEMYHKGFNFIEEYDTCNHVSPPEVGTSGHYFFMTYGWIIHLVEFARKSNYLWHSALRANNCSSLPNREDLHFVAYDGVYENFYGVIINQESKITLPPKPLRFLHEMKTSKFLSCRALLMPKEKHPEESKVGNIIREMKAILQPYFYDFWLTSGTLLGWYRECGIIPYTSDVDFGMRASDVKSLESILQLFRKSRSLKLVMRYGLFKNKQRDVYFKGKAFRTSWLGNMAS
ncbi:Fukutin like protein [Argiope bruennichi]|uniref:Fukutin like protein n=1 Tax=Argiope bruennichi TaxID=94029 RepID=A0A8T0E1W9_ARGBR|nr:Fukutin like protein [Argiope bruennichi]